jgi:hypothetical protein
MKHNGLVALIILLAMALLIGSTPARAVNYQIKQITKTANVQNIFPKINDLGQIVWQGVDLPIQKGTTSIYCYSGGISNNLTNSVYYAMDPFVNNRGQIVWRGSGEIGSGFYIYNNDITTKISNASGTPLSSPINDNGQVAYWLYESGAYNIILQDINNGSKTYITKDQPPLTNTDAIINNKGDIVWSKYDGSHMNIFLYSGGNLTDNTKTGINYSYKINDNGQVVWSCGSGNNYQIYLYDKQISSNPINISSNSYNNRSIQINNSGKVVWQCWGGGHTTLYLYDIHQQTLNPLDDMPSYNDYAPGLNDTGQVVFVKSGNIYLWFNGNIIQITSDNGNCQPQINNLGQIVWAKGYYGLDNMDIFLATPQAINVPIPTAAPPIETCPQAANLFVEVSSFIKNHKGEFSLSSQQFFDDNKSAIDRFISKFITSKDGFKESAKLWKNVFNILGNALSVAAISADAKKSTIKGINSLLLYVDKNLLYRILHLDNDYQLRSYIDVLTNAKVPTNGYSLVFSSGSIFSELYTGMFSLIADDPPDPNFTEVFQCPVAITAPFSFSGVSPDINKLYGLYIGSSYNTYYYLLGLTTSINRYSSALAAGDAISAGLQFEAFVAYLTLYDQSAIQHADLTRQLKQSLIDQGLQDVSYNKQDILNLQNQIQLNGLPPEVTASFKNLGLTDSQISDLTQAALDFIPPDSVSGSLYSNLSGGVDLLHAASSWRPPNPALYLLLMD